MRNSPEVAVVIPAFNEEEGIGPTLQELRDVLGDPALHVVDGNSGDDTVSIAKELEAEVLPQTGKGKGLAVAQVLEQIDLDARYVVFIDADYTYPAEYIPKMIEILEKNPNVGMVIGNRFNRKSDSGEAISGVLYLGNKLLALAQRLLNGVRLCDPLSGLRVVKRDLLKYWRPKSRCFDIEVELNSYVERMGYYIKEIPISYRHRLGQKKLKLKHGLTILKRILVERLSA